MDYGARAKENFQSGYSCAQAVFLACTENMGLDTETRARLASSFGGGMGGMRQVCGAVSGMLMALGLHQGYTDPKDKAGKAAQYESSAGSFWGWMKTVSPSRRRTARPHIMPSAHAQSFVRRLERFLNAMWRSIRKMANDLACERCGK